MFWYQQGKWQFNYENKWAVNILTLSSNEHIRLGDYFQVNIQRFECISKVEESSLKVL